MKTRTDGRRGAVRRIWAAGVLLAAAVAGGAEPPTAGELGTARFRAEALAALRDKVAADRDEVGRIRTRLEERTGELRRHRSELYRFLRGNDVDPAQIARVGDPEVIEFAKYSEAVLGAVKRNWERDWKEARKNARAGDRPGESPAESDSGWSSVEQVISMELGQRLWDLRRARNQVDYANADLARAEEQLDWHLRYYDEGELKRLEALLAGAAPGPAPAAPADAPPAADETPPSGFGDAATVAVEPLDGPGTFSMPPASSEALLARFNDACSVRNWALAEATLAEAARQGASWRESGGRALRHERERAAEGDQAHFTRCLELESALLGASRRGDWTAVQAFAAQARQEGCALRPEARMEIQRALEQQRRQGLIDFTMQQMLHRILLNTNPFAPLHDAPRSGPVAPGASPPAPAGPPPPPNRPTGGGPVHGSGST